MADSLNKVQLIGRLGKDPEVRTIGSGTEVVSFSVATEERYKDKNGEWIGKVEWHRISSFVPVIVNAAKKLSKGSKVYVEGQLETRKWTDQSGVEKFSTDVVLKQFGGTLINLDPRDGGGGGDVSQERQATQARTQSNNNQEQKNNDNFQFEDDIPFGLMLPLIGAAASALAYLPFIA